MPFSKNPLKVIVTWRSSLPLIAVAINDHFDVPRKQIRFTDWAVYDASVSCIRSGTDGESGGTSLEAEWSATKGYNVMR
jgi:hypothetical protein